MKTYKHDWLREEWERMGRPDRSVLDKQTGIWLDIPNEGIDIDTDFFEEEQYRIKSKPSINWEHVHPSIIAMATDDCEDSTFLYTRKPLIGSVSWGCGGCVADASHFLSFTQGTCDWKDSLVMRPVVVGEE